MERSEEKTEREIFFQKVLQTSSEWDNVVGSAMKDVESNDVELQCAAIKGICLIPVAKVCCFDEEIVFSQSLIR